MGEGAGSFPPQPLNPSCPHPTPPPTGEGAGSLPLSRAVCGVGVGGRLQGDSTFAVLALSDQPAYLQEPIIQWAGTISVCTFFGSLLAAMLVAIPHRKVHQKDNLTEMRQLYLRLQGRKAILLRTAQIVFLIGTACLVTVILAILWKI